jgi:hypothetical protein
MGTVNIGAGEGIMSPFLSDAVVFLSFRRGEGAGILQGADSFCGKEAT